MRRSSSHPAPAAPPHLGAPSAAPAVPVLLVLDPMMTGRPWSLAVARAASTLQVHELSGDDLAAAATIAFALEVQAIERVAVAGEGRGEPPAAFAQRVDAVRRLARSAGARPVPVDALWLEHDTGRVLVVSPDAATDTGAPLLDALLHPGRPERLDA